MSLTLAIGLHGELAYLILISKNSSKRSLDYIYLLYKLQCVIGILATEKCRIRTHVS